MTNKTARARFTRFHPLFKCAVCGKLTRNPDDGGTGLCKECYEDAGIENEHSDTNGEHADKEYCAACGGKTHLQRRQEREARK